MSWYKWKRKSKHLLLVEDPVSAIRAASVVHTISLFGTNLSESKVEEILENDVTQYDHVFVCLDNDATFQAIKLQLQWRGRIKNLQVRGLGKDVKDMTDEEFNRFISNVR